MNECRSWVYEPRRSKIGSSKQIVGECKYKGLYLGDNCIQNVHLGKYIVGYMVGNSFLRRRVSGAVKRISDHIADDIPPQMKILNMVISILMHFLTCIRQ